MYKVTRFFIEIGEKKIDLLVPVAYRSVTRPTGAVKFFRLRQDERFRAENREIRNIFNNLKGDQSTQK